jgi:hypothetical protein
LLKKYDDKGYTRLKHLHTRLLNPAPFYDDQRKKLNAAFEQLEKKVNEYRKSEEKLKLAKEVVRYFIY